MESGVIDLCYFIILQTSSHSILNSGSSNRQPWNITRSSRICSQIVSDLCSFHSYYLFFFVTFKSLFDDNWPR